MSGERDPDADLAEMLDALGNDRRVLGEVIELFLANAPALLADLRAAVAMGDDRRIARIAHRLRGSVAQFSDGEVNDSLTRLEHLALSDDLSEAPSELTRMESALTTLVRAMRSYRLPESGRAQG